MKKLMFVALATAALTACSMQPKYTISGQVEGLEGTIYLTTREAVLDSTSVENGAFKLSGELEKPMVAYLANNANLRAATVRALVLLEEGDIVLSVDSLGEAYVTGTKANDANTTNAKKKMALFAEYRDEATTPERRAEIESEYESLGRVALEENLDNLYGLVVLDDEMYGLTGTEAEELAAKFSPEMQATDLMAKLQEVIAVKKRTEVGQPYIDFTQPDAEGNGVSLKSVIENPANKYVLVDFWASWCSPCMAEVPALKAAYDEFHKKGFEIFGVSLDNRKEAWEAAIKNKELNWLHVSDLKGWENAAAAEYGVKSIPSNYLVDCATGQIVGVNLRGEAVAEKVAEFLK